MKITVVTATYNSAATICATLASIREQTHINIEHVVVDGLSTDNTVELVRAWGSENTLLDIRSDHGIYDALNRGVALASGDVVGFLHSDDFFKDPSVLSEIAQVFEDSEVDACYGDLSYVSAKDVTQIVRRWKSGEFSGSRFQFGWMPPHPTVYVRRTLLEQTPFDKSFRISGDYDLMVKLFSRPDIKVAYIPRELVCMRLGGESNKTLLNIALKMKEDLAVIRSNNIGGLFTLICKSLRKLPQFI